MKKIKRNNVFVLFIFMISTSIVFSDLYQMLIKPIFTSYLISWTILGFITFVIAFYFMIESYEYIKKELSNTPIQNVIR